MTIGELFNTTKVGKYLTLELLGHYAGIYDKTFQIKGYWITGNTLMLSDDFVTWLGIKFDLPVRKLEEI